EMMINRTLAGRTSIVRRRTLRILSLPLFIAQYCRNRTIENVEAFTLQTFQGRAPGRQKGNKQLSSTTMLSANDRSGSAFTGGTRCANSYRPRRRRRACYLGGHISSAR